LHDNCFKPDLRITKLNKYSVMGEWRFEGLDDFDDITIINGYSYYGLLSEKDRKKQKTKKVLKITGLALTHGLVGYGAFRLGKL